MAAPALPWKAFKIISSHLTLQKNKKWCLSAHGANSARASIHTIHTSNRDVPHTRGICSERPPTHHVGSECVSENFQFAFGKPNRSKPRSSCPFPSYQVPYRQSTASPDLAFAASSSNTSPTVKQNHKNVRCGKSPTRMCWAPPGPSRKQEPSELKGGSQMDQCTQRAGSLPHFIVHSNHLTARQEHRTPDWPLHVSSSFVLKLLLALTIGNCTFWTDLHKAFVAFKYFLLAVPYKT